MKIPYSPVTWLLCAPFLMSLPFSAVGVEQCKITNSEQVMQLIKKHFVSDSPNDFTCIKEAARDGNAAANKYLKQVLSDEQWQEFKQDIKINNSTSA